MARPQKPRKPIALGDAIKRMRHNGDVRIQVADEEAKHRAKLVDLADREREIQLSSVAPLIRAARLTRIVHQRAEEIRRHHVALERLNKRFR